MSQFLYVHYMNAMHMLIENQRRELVSDLTLYLERLSIKQHDVVLKLIADNAEANYYVRYGEMIHVHDREELLRFDVNALPQENRWMIYRIRLLYLFQQQRYDELQAEALHYIRYARGKKRYRCRCLAEGYRMLAMKHLACKNYDKAYEYAQLQSHYTQHDDVATKNDYVCAKLLLLEASIEAKKQPRILALLQELQMPALLEGLTREYHQFLLLKARYYIKVERYSDALHICTHVIDEQALSNEERKQLFKTKLDVYKKVNQLVRYNQTKRQYEQFLKRMNTAVRQRATSMYSSDLLAPLHGQLSSDEPVVAIVLQLEVTETMTHAQKLRTREKLLKSCQQLHDVLYVEMIYEELLLVLRMQSEQHVNKLIASLQAQANDEWQQTLCVGKAWRNTHNEQTVEELVLQAYIEFLNERMKWERMQIENVSDEQLC